MKDKKNELQKLKEQFLKRLAEEGFHKLSQILSELKPEYKELASKYVKDTEQSWKPFKGKLLEEAVIKMIETEAKSLNLEVVRGSKIEKLDSKLNKCLGEVKRSILVDYGEFGFHMPDADLVVYNPRTCKAVAIVSVKTTLRERVAQTGYWKLKLLSSPVTENVKVIFITLDEDGDLRKKIPAKKGRAIVEKDVDLTCVISEEFVEESDKVKNLQNFIAELRRLILVQFKGKI